MEKIKYIEKLKKYRVYIICTIIIILSIISIILQKNEKLLINNNNVKSNDESYIAVYITGAVKKEGVYNIKKDARICDVIDATGGVKEEADLEKINLAKKVIDGEKIDIPYKEKAVENLETSVETEIDETDKININKATKEQLMELDGIGEISANNIIEYRKKSNFEYIEDLMNVKGIGNAKFEKIKDRLEV